MRFSQKHIAALVITFVSFTTPLQAEDTLVHMIDFTDYQEGSVEDWLQSKGFMFERDAKKRNRIDFGVGDNGLLIEAKRRAFGLISNESVNVPVFKSFEIEWGVNQHPKGASYEQGIRNEAVMVIVFMGDENSPSGSMFIPDAPYFIGLFLCSGDDRINHPYVGKYFTKGGRYVCGDRPDPGSMVITQFDLAAAYRSYFDKEGDDDPGISGIALALDTKSASEGGKSSAFVKSIKFYR